MTRRKAVTTMNDIINIIKNVADDEQRAIQFIDALSSVIPVKKTKRTKAPDPYLNKTLSVKRYNGTYTVQILGLDSCLPDCYIAKVISIDSTTSHIKVGDSLTISKRELQLTSRKVF